MLPEDLAALDRELQTLTDLGLHYQESLQGTVLIERFIEAVALARRMRDARPDAATLARELLTAFWSAATEDPYIVMHVAEELTQDDSRPRYLTDTDTAGPAAASFYDSLVALAAAVDWEPKT